MKKILTEGQPWHRVLLFLSLLFITFMASNENPWAQGKADRVSSRQLSGGDETKPKRLPKLIIAQKSDASTVDAHHVIDSPTASIMEHMVETLLELTPTGEIAPKLAEKWEVSADATEFTLKLRKGIKFHDGQPFNAAAVKVNLDRRLDPRAGTKFGFLVSQIASVTVIDEYIVKIKTKIPFSPLLSHLTYTTNGIQSPMALKRSWNKPLIMPIGTGPFIFKEWVPGNRVGMVQNDDYWGTKPFLSELIFRAIPEDASRVAALEKGAVHVATQIPSSDLATLRGNPKIMILQTPSVKTIYMGFHCGKEPFTDRRVRQALNYAVNKEAIVNHSLEDGGRVSDAPISPGVFGYAPIQRYEYNVEKARTLLAQAGFPEGFETTLTFPAGRHFGDSAVVNAVTEDLLNVGVKVDVQMMEWEPYLSYLLQEQDAGDHKIFLLGWGCVTGNADYGLYFLFHSTEWPKKGLNLSFFKNEWVDQLLDLARRTADPKGQKKIYKEAMTIIMDEAPWLFLYGEIQRVGVNADVKDIIVHPTERVIAKQARIESKE